MTTLLPTVEGGFGVVTCDPPWRFKSNSAAAPGRNAMRHYDCMTLEEIKAMPVGDVAAPDCHLFLWITGPFLSIGAHLPILKAWGFKPTAMGFVWVKLNRSVTGDTFRAKDLFMGGGFTTRKNGEFVILAKRGRPKRLAADVLDIIMSPVREHSRKPDEFFRRVERYCEGPRLELFGRESRPGWAVWGDQSTMFDEERLAA